MAGDPVQLAHHHPDDLGAGRGLDAEQAFHGQAVPQLVEERREIVGAGDERDALLPRSIFGVLLDARVQITDHGPARHHVLAVQLQDQPEHPVRGGVLRPHVDDHGFLRDRSVHRYRPR